MGTAGFCKHELKHCSWLSSPRCAGSLRCSVLYLYLQKVLARCLAPCQQTGPISVCWQISLISDTLINVHSFLLFLLCGKGTLNSSLRTGFSRRGYCIAFKTLSTYSYELALSTTYIFRTCFSLPLSGFKWQNIFAKTNCFAGTVLGFCKGSKRTEGFRTTPWIPVNKATWPQALIFHVWILQECEILTTNCSTVSNSRQSCCCKAQRASSHHLSSPRIRPRVLFVLNAAKLRPFFNMHAPFLSKK